MIAVLFILVVIGVAVWWLNTTVQMAPAYKTLINILVALGVLGWLLDVFGIMHLRHFVHLRLLW